LRTLITPAAAGAGARGRDLVRDVDRILPGSGDGSRVSTAFAQVRSLGGNCAHTFLHNTV